MLTRQNKLTELDKSLETIEEDFQDQMDKFIEAKGEDYALRKMNSVLNEIVDELNLKHEDYVPKEKKDNKQDNN